MKIVFMGTPDFAAKSLEKLIDSKHEIALVVTKEDKPANRGYELQMTPVKKLALENNIEVITPSKVKGNDELFEKLKNIEADVFCVVAYGKILPKNILDLPKKGCVNVHGSLLPKYRGAAPIQFAVINGDEKTGVTTMYMDEGVDTGDILKVSEYAITDEDTAETVFDKLADMGGDLLVDTLNAIEDGTVTRTKQNEDEATHCGMLTKKDGEINFDMETKKLFSFVRGMTPWPSAYTYLDGKMLKVLDLKKVLDENSNAVPGTVISTSDDGVLVKTNDGAILITKLQLEGKKAMDAGDFLRGRKIPDGTLLGIKD
ncbi:MAG: methionyl-tRNA formyltransferase [archaeon]|nr:methionyl-tRNA formyltransferase [archaeon]